MSEEKFAGFGTPEENWSKLPNEFIKALPVMSSKAEIAIVLYILRHTWGYREYDAPKHITTDEFAKGRKRRDGTRIDGGVGMSEPAIRAGIKAAIRHGFILVEVNDSDKARIEKSYMLKMVGENSLPPTSEGDSKEFTPNGKKSTPDQRKKPEERNSIEIPTFLNKTSVIKADGRMLLAYFNANLSDLSRMFKLNGKDLQFVPFVNESLKTQRDMVWQHVNATRLLAEHGATLADYLAWLTAHFNWRKNGVTVNAYEFGDMVSTYLTTRPPKKQSAPQVVIAPEPVEEVVTAGELAARRALTQSVRPEWEMRHE